MLETITSEVRNKLREIGFEEDEISTIQIVHELKTKEYCMDIKKLINKAAFQNLSEGIAETFETHNWDEECFFHLVETYRKERRITADIFIEKYLIIPENTFGHNC